MEDMDCDQIDAAAAAATEKQRAFCEKFAATKIQRAYRERLRRKVAVRLITRAYIEKKTMARIQKFLQIIRRSEEELSLDGGDVDLYEDFDSDKLFDDDDEDDTSDCCYMPPSPPDRMFKMTGFPYEEGMECNLPCAKPERWA